MPASRGGGARVRPGAQRTRTGIVTLQGGRKVSLSLLAQQIISNIASGHRLHRVGTVQVHRHILDIIDSHYTEKFTPSLGIVFPSYYYGVKPYLATSALSPHVVTTAAGPRYPLIQKSFSGDVSGNIGESLFICVAGYIYGIDTRYIIHLRPEKKQMFTPDFVVIRRHDAQAMTTRILRQVCYHCPRFPINKLFVECKASMSGMVGKERVVSGLAQLLTVLNRGDAGILFLVQRRNQGSPLHAVLVPLLRV